MLPVKPYHRLKVIAAISIIGLGLWIGIWFLAVLQYHRVIDGWVSTQRAMGYEVEYDNRMTVGFPHHIMLRFDNLRWKNTDNIIFKADHMFLSALPWQWQKFHAKFKGHVELAAPIETGSTALVLGGNEGHASVGLDKDGTWKFSEVSLEQAHIGRAPDYLFTAESLKATAIRPDHPPKDHRETSLTVTGDAQNVILPKNMPSPFGPLIKVMHLELNVMGEMPDFRKKASLSAWNDASGVVEFDALHMVWGPLELTGKGTIGFDDALQPEGAFASTIVGHEAVLKALSDYGFIAPRQKAMMDSALSLFAKPTDYKQGSGLDMPITIQLSGLFLGPVKIFSFPEIEWDDDSSH